MEKELLKTINILLKGIGVEEMETLNSSLHLAKDLEIDSISKAELIVLIEEQFGVDISLATTVGEIRDSILESKTV